MDYFSFPMNRTGRSAKGDAIVYSTDHGRMCPECGNPSLACSCKANASVAPRGDGTVKISLDTKGRNGKAVTVVRGIPLPLQELERLTKELKRQCGSGGTLKEFVVEVQGDHRETVAKLLKGRGFKVIVR